MGGGGARACSRSRGGAHWPAAAAAARLKIATGACRRPQLRHGRRHEPNLLRQQGGQGRNSLIGGSSSSYWQRQGPALLLLRLGVLRLGGWRQQRAARLPCCTSHTHTRLPFHPPPPQVTPQQILDGAVEPPEPMRELYAALDKVGAGMLPAAFFSCLLRCPPSQRHAVLGKAGACFSPMPWLLLARSRAGSSAPPHRGSRCGVAVLHPLLSSYAPPPPGHGRVLRHRGGGSGGGPAGVL